MCRRRYGKRSLGDPTEVSFQIGKTGGSHTRPGLGNRVGAIIPRIHNLSKAPLQPVPCEKVEELKSKIKGLRDIQNIEKTK